MAVYKIDSKLQGLRATGVVEPVMEWVDDPATGRRRQADQQARSEQGVLLWGVEVLYQSESFGRQSTTTSRVTVPATTSPEPTAYEVIDFDELTVSVSVNKVGTMRESWRAEGIKTAAATGSARIRDAA